MLNNIQDVVQYSNISATTAAFTLKGGQYGLTVTATFGGGSITLQRLSADGTTWVTAATAVSAAGYSTAYLSQGSYRFAVATATAVYIDLTQIF